MVSPAPGRQDSAPSIGVGTWAWGNRLLWGYEPSQDAQLEETFGRCLERGLTFFDTADSYGTGRLNGRSEALLGRFCAALPPERRAELTVATKLAPYPWRLGRQGYAAAFAASLERLGGKLDRVQLHWSTARYAPWQEGPLLEGLADLVEQGTVASLGVSNMGPRRLRQVQSRLAERGVRLTSLQVQMSLLAPQPLAPGGVVEVCEELGIALIAYSPLALGLLACAPGPRPPRPRGPRALLWRRLWPGLQPLLEAVAAVATAHGATPVEVALNWCRAHGAMPIPGLRRLDQVDATSRALTWTLSPTECQELDSLASSTQAAGVAMPANPFVSA
ncbi:MAG: aldo/keto reductase [Synechococcaceae cyanobacterium]|jgi:pyridoxine 4-dehydrogenase